MVYTFCYHSEIVIIWREGTSTRAVSADWRCRDFSAFFPWHLCCTCVTVVPRKSRKQQERVGQKAKKTARKAS